MRTVCDRCEGADPVGEDGGGEVFAGTGTGGSLISKDPTHAATPGLRGSHAEPVPVSQGSPARKGEQSFPGDEGHIQSMP